MGRAPCCDKNGLKKGPWTPEEDQKLIDYIEKHGQGSWRTLPKNAGLARCGKSCRLRWTNYLRPDIKRGRFSFEEEETIIQLHAILGNKWSAIAARLPGRTDNEIKNYWNTHIRKRLLRMGIDPTTHRPRLDLLELSSLLNQAIVNQAQLDISRLLGVEPLLNSDLLMWATGSLFKQSQLPQESHLLTAGQLELLPSLLQNSSQFLNAEPFSQASDPLQFSQSFMPPNVNLGYESYEQMLPNSVSEATNIEIFGEQNNNNMGSLLSTPASSPVLNNSVSTAVNSSREDDMDSYSSNFFDFQFPNLLDVSDLM
ncbi:hypothetical protein HPP92_011983 [Vanilla planifolia]|uniref:Uncharacterized protein n=1 Tax=Vanilla planifolia TaxID=51239 RepID=A0A835R7Z8_VANPL|nr:hypothetical protein HPP92_011983 [Vanilla planifolia]